jgi:hypothetical protein
VSDRKPVQASIAAEQHTAFKVKLALDGKSQQEFIADAIREYLKPTAKADRPRLHPLTASSKSSA